MQIATSARLGVLLLAGLVTAPAALSLQPADEHKPAQAGQPEQRGQPGQPGERRGPGGPGAGGPVSVEAAMKQMGRALRQLRKQADQPAMRDDNLKLLNDMQRACAAAKSAPVPGDIIGNAADAAEKAKMTEAYRKNLVASMRLLLDIEDAVADGKGDVAKAKSDELVKLRDAAHKELGVKQD